VNGKFVFQIPYDTNFFRKAPKQVRPSINMDILPSQLPYKFFTKILDDSEKYDDPFWNSTAERPEDPVNFHQQHPTLSTLLAPISNSLHRLDQHITAVKESKLRRRIAEL